MKSPCIIVNRVSSAEQKDGYSLDAQSRMGRQYATDNKLEIIHEFTFQESASKMSEQRQFDEVLTFIKAYCIKQKQTLNIIVEKKDRWGRLHSRKEFIQKLVLDGQVIVHYYRERQVFDKKCSPEDIFMDDVVTSMNKYVAMNIGREAKKGMLEKARQGWLPHKPPPGYVNNPDRNSLIAIVPNENERQWIQRMFELRGKHGFSYDAITKKLIEEGLVPKNRLSVFRKSYTERILKNPFYCGRFIFAGQEYEGKH